MITCKLVPRCASDARLCRKMSAEWSGAGQTWRWWHYRRPEEYQHRAAKSHTQVINYKQNFGGQI